VEPDKETGELRNRCERVRQTLRHCAGQPDQVVESVREDTDAPLERGQVHGGGGGAADTAAGDLLRPFLGAAGVERFFGGVDTLGDAMRMAQRMELALADAFPELRGEQTPPEGAEPRRLRDMLPRLFRGDEDAGNGKDAGGASSSVPYKSWHTGPSDSSLRRGGREV
jgi:hypothetical protein